jgi:hypothetical protein
MKKIFILLFFFLMACIGNKSNKESKIIPETQQDAGLVTFKFKVDGIQDSIIADSIWRMIFTVQGIDKLVISKVDSTIIFSIDPKLTSNKALKAEITRRGGKIINTLPR